MASASDFQTAVRWTQEADIDLSSQGGSFNVTGLPTSKRRLVLEFNDVVSDTNNVDLQLQISDDNGSTFYTSSNYSIRTIDTNANTKNDSSLSFFKLSSSIGIKDSSSFPFFGSFDIPHFNETDSAQFYVTGSYQVQGLAHLGGGRYTDSTGQIDAIKISLSSGNFNTGTLRIWSA